MRSTLRGRDWWAWASALLALAGVIAGQPLLLGLAAVVLMGGGAARWWGSHALDDVAYRREFSARRAFPGETLGFRAIVDNRKLLPLPWLEVEDHLPEALRPDDVRVSASHLPKQVVLRGRAALSWRQRAAWPATLRCRERGYFRFGPVRLRAADPFGLYETSAEDDRLDAIIVYPRIAPLDGLHWPAARPFGELRGRDRIYEDPLRISGVRDYEPRDPLRRIDWKATARRGALQARQYEPSASLALVIALDAATLEHVWQGYDPELLERAVSAAAGLAARAEAARVPFGLLANTSFPESDREIEIAPSRAPGQLALVLESLAVVGPFVLTPMEDLLAAKGRQLPIGASLAVVGADLRPALAAALEAIAADGHPTLFIATGDETPAIDAARFTVFHAGPAIRDLLRRDEWSREDALRPAGVAP